MKKLLIIFLFFTIQASSQNLYLSELLYKESEKQAYVGAGILIATFTAQHFINDNRARNVVLAGGITASVSVNICYMRKKHKIRNLFKHKNRKSVGKSNYGNN